MRATATPVNEAEDFRGTIVGAAEYFRATKPHGQIPAIMCALVFLRVVAKLAVRRVKVLAVTLDQKRAGRLGIVDGPIRPIDAPFELRHQQQPIGAVRRFWGEQKSSPAVLEEQYDGGAQDRFNRAVGRTARFYGNSSALHHAGERAAKCDRVEFARYLF